MGYTHYATIDYADPNWPEVFGRTALDAVKILEECERRGVVGQRSAERTDRGVPFVIDPWAVDEGAIFIDDCLAESFLVRAVFDGSDYQPELLWRTRCGWICCKTNREPYDLAVMAILFRLWSNAVKFGSSERGPCVAIASDGQWDGAHCEGCRNHDGTDWFPEWVEARQFLDEIFPSGERAALAVAQSISPLQSGAVPIPSSFPR
jgi:hypothetical protein